ncbi:hypothetical protein WA538_000206, partial [Blastocystis sp. DL]
MSEGNPEEKVPISSPPSLTDTLSKQIRELNKRMLNLEQEKERYKSEVENVKAFLAEELQLSGNVTMSLKEMEARFRGYRRREEEREEARIMEHNRKVSDLFSTVRQNMKLYEKRLNDVVSSLVARAREEAVLSVESLNHMEESLETLTQQKEAHLSTNAALAERDKDVQIAELMDENKRLLNRLHVLEEIQKAYRCDSTSIHQEEQVDLCTLKEELRSREEELKQLRQRVELLDTELDESERIRQQQHQQLLLIVSGATEPVKETDGEEKGRMKLELARMRADQKQTASEMAALTNRNGALERRVKELETETSLLQKRYETCRKERERERTRLEESEKIQGTVMATLRELETSHEEEMEKAVAVAREAANAQGSEAAEATLRDTMTQMNYYYRQKEKNTELLVYQRMEEFLMNRVRQLSTQLNRVNAVACEALDVKLPQLPPDALTKMTPVELAELSHPLPVLNMPYLREVVVKFIGFPRGSSERACLLPVMKMLLSLGQREMKIIQGDMSYKEPSRIPMEKPLVRNNAYVDSGTVLSEFRNSV